MTTGPTPVPDFVQSGMNESIFYHRGPKFAEIMQDCKKLLPPVFGTQGEVLILTGSGTLAMEGAIANFVNPKDTVIAVNSGKFGERWRDQAKIYGCNVVEIFVERGQAVDVAEIQKLAEKHPETRAILAHASETSTGVRHDIKSIAKICRSLKDCLCLVDGVTAVGVFKVPMDEWGIDVLIAGSQKGFMLPPGISFAAVGERAWARTEEITNVRYYMDWRKERKANAEDTGAFTSPVAMVGGLRKALQYMHETGLEEMWRRSWKNCFATRSAAKAMGFDLLVKEDNIVSSACTAIMAEGPYTKLIRERFSMVLSGGQDELKGKIVRLGHMGYIDAWDLLSQFQAVAWVAKQLGKKVDVEAGVTAFFDVALKEEDLTPADLRN